MSNRIHVLRPLTVLEPVGEWLLATPEEIPRGNLIHRSQPQRLFSNRVIEKGLFHYRHCRETVLPCGIYELAQIPHPGYKVRSPFGSAWLVVRGTEKGMNYLGWREAALERIFVRRP